MGTAMNMVKPLISGEAHVRLRNLIGWGLTGQISYVISQFLLLVALTRHARVEDVGLFGLVSAITLPIYWFFNLGIRVNQATDTRSEFGFQDFLALRIVASIFAYGLIVAIALLAVGPAAAKVMLVFGAAKGVETYSELCYGAFQKYDRMPFVAHSLIVRGFGGTAMFWVLIAATGSTSAAYGGLLAVWMLVALALDMRRAQGLARRAGDVIPAQAGRVRDLAWSSLPLAFNALLSAFQSSMPRYMIAHFLSVAALGQFTVVGYAMQAVTTVSNAIGQSIVARLALYAATGNRRAFGRVLIKFVTLIGLTSTAGAIAMIAIGDWLLALVFGADYADLGGLLALVMLASGVVASATMLQSGLMATRRFKVNLNIRIATFAVVTLGTAIGAMKFDLSGVVFGMMAAGIVQAGLLAWSLWRSNFELGQESRK